MKNVLHFCCPFCYLFYQLILLILPINFHQVGLCNVKIVGYFCVITISCAKLDVKLRK